MIQPIMVQQNITRSVGIKNNQQMTSTSFSGVQHKESNFDKHKKLVYELFGIAACGIGILGAIRLNTSFKVSNNMKKIFDEIGESEYNKFNNYLNQFKLNDRLTLSKMAIENLAEYKENPQKVKKLIHEKGETIKYSNFRAEEERNNKKNDDNDDNFYNWAAFEDSDGLE